MTGQRDTTVYDRFKRMGDIGLAILGLVVSGPLQFILALLIWKKLGGPVLFRQRRPGRNGEIFELVKFRSMLPPDVENGLLTDKQRLTPFGQRLRSTSLDELPTLINVLKGDMSIVGPRPLLVEYLERYSDEQRRRHEVRPGVTGLAQVRGRNLLTWDEKFDLDIEYVRRRSFMLDLQILVETVGSVILRRGISAAGEVTMPKFTGGESPELDVNK